jgi:FlaA1/EpsC-like NDP-sugar epimerase
VQLFRKQIEKGGPVTLTDPKMARYFMTIPEAVQLIIRAGALGRGGEVFVLEMGDPVSILDLAVNMIKLSGRDPERDISIEIIGPRPGEKLQEELFNERESPTPTAVERILKADRPPLDPEWVEEVFDQVERLVAERDEAFLAQRISELVRQPGQAVEELLEPVLPAQRASSGGEAG